jgi:hypothetical protein
MKISACDFGRLFSVFDKVQTETVSHYPEENAQHQIVDNAQHPEAKQEAQPKFKDAF